MAGLVIEGAESELLASPLAIINSSSEPIDPDVNLKWRKQNQNHERDWPVKLVVFDLLPHSHQSLNMFKSCFVKHSLIFFFLHRNYLTEYF